MLLYGRDAERSIIGVEGARESRSGVLVIRGEAGVGKSALLKDAREQASEMQILGCVGVESESALPFAALHQLLRPVLGQLQKVPRPQADALRGALGLTAARGDDRFLISLAVLSLLAEAAEPRPLLLLRRRRALAGRRLVRRARVRRKEVRGRGDRAAVRRPGRRSSGVRCTRAGRPTTRRGRSGCSWRAARRSCGQCALARDSRAAGRSDWRAPARLELPSTLSEAQLAGSEPLLTPLPVSARS